jgi:hypothetical protein
LDDDVDDDVDDDDVDDVVGGLRGNLGLLRAQTQEARTPFGVRQYFRLFSFTNNPNNNTESSEKPIQTLIAMNTNIDNLIRTKLYHYT